MAADHATCRIFLRPCGEPVLQIDVPELVERACLSQCSALVSIGEEAHQ